MPGAASGTLMSSSRTKAVLAIPERTAPTLDQFRAEILPAARPVVMRAMVCDWPLVIAAREGPETAMATLEAVANASEANVLRADPSLEGRFHYANAEYEMNFVRGQGNIAGILAGLREQESSYRPYAIAAQSLVADHHFPGFSQAHPMPLLPADVGPRVWIGNAAKVATHKDDVDNIAVVAVGRRRFTLFPPDAEPYLYMGPADRTPAGTPISMVHVTAPDFERFPLFEEALAMAQEAELSPGDAIFIPNGWFHHVEALDRFNVLVNYWWDGATGLAKESVDE